MVFGYLSEALPFLHHHEEQHVCVQVDGSWYYLEATPHGSSSPDNEILVAMHLGKGHEHEICALCQLLPSLLDVTLEETVYPGGEPFLSLHETLAHGAAVFGPNLPRGPPVFS